MNKKKSRNPDSKEIEFKYAVPYMEAYYFIGLCNGILPSITCEYAEGTDDFYENKEKPNSFFRHRVGGDTNQLTYKEKISTKNNFIRIEHNLDLKENCMKIPSFLQSLGYVYNTSLKKKTWIYKTEKYLIAYYICFRSILGRDFEAGRFLEIEVSEDYKWKNVREAYSELCFLEKKFKVLGCNPKSRVIKSLWEMYKK